MRECLEDRRRNDNKEWETIKGLKEQGLTCTKADKSNEVVVMKEEDYKQRVEEMIKSGQYEEIKFKNKFPDDKLQNKVKEDLQTLVDKGIVSKWEKIALTTSNPNMPRLYALPKTHKEGDKMRQIVTNVNAPTSRIAKYLTRKTSELKQPKGFAIKNTKELLEKMKDLKIWEDEELVSFDVEALYPSVPIDGAIKAISNWADEQNISDETAEKLVELSKICLNQSIFKWNDKYFRQTSGLSIGNGYSSFAANVFMCELETEASREKWFPRFWARYVDDVIAVVKKSQVEKTLEELNKRSPTIKFTIEREKNGKIPFLDLMIEVIGENLSFDIYRKPQHVQRYIPNDSNHPLIHKMSAFDSMINRLFNTPLNQENFDKEKRYIIETAQINGYRREMIESLMKKHDKKKKLRQLTTLEPHRRQPKQVTSNGKQR
jgi:Reverse transcriptase (RNA-dependent DNA polymerase)